MQLAYESHTSLLDLLDYENGVTLDQLQEFSAAVTKNSIRYQKSQVILFQTAIAGLFDHKIVNHFNQTLDRIAQTVDSLLPQKPVNKEDAMRASMVELSKLTSVLTGRPSLSPVGAR